MQSTDTTHLNCRVCGCEMRRFVVRSPERVEHFACPLCSQNACRFLDALDEAEDALLADAPLEPDRVAISGPEYHRLDPIPLSLPEKLLIAAMGVCAIAWVVYHYTPIRSWLYLP